jgi:hypothetical protein
MRRHNSPICNHSTAFFKQIRLFTQNFLVESSHRPSFCQPNYYDVLYKMDRLLEFSLEWQINETQMKTFRLLITKVFDGHNLSNPTPQSFYLS